MKILFPASPLDERKPDESYAEEYESAQAAGFTVGLVNLEELLLNRDPVRAIRMLKAEEERTEAIYRGWMLKPADYALLFDTLKSRNLRLINTPEQYKHAHYLPESYDKIAGRTPESVWVPAATPEPPMNEVYEAIRVFGERPIVVKDYVKSRKHEWLEACYIPNAADRDQVERVVRTFLDRQGDELNEGLVFREFVELELLSHHPRSGMPLSRETRVFVLDGKPAYVSNYWSAGEDREFEQALSEFVPTIAEVESRFFTMDFAKRKNGPWIVLELGDGQTAGLPDDTDAGVFYRKLSEALHG
ncbi:ATP-grasp domain-containing protein [Saccharibacillus sp. CPCC 101409]|uniref:ATP-grasp domain-containing protein n=1 Tax=Saccharibacillus sp. CPCC 101409 TaxID=3058041 RepID=UPI0026720E8A|nr:ATP-grasp domain-containing protein [Saccharibacillus sp. CPCC 101409]MDO3409440.1 ATP-grasp domain-containing protein [Saccharibacillus sp. CPCC 101409]